MIMQAKTKHATVIMNKATHVYRFMADKYIRKSTCHAHVN